MLNYQVGDKVIHQNFGLGEIVEMDEKFIHERQMLCYVVRTQNLTLWVAADDSEISSIRPPTPEGNFDHLFGILRSTAEPLPTDRYERKTNLFERMKAGDLASICAVIRDLVQFRRVKKLNDSDKTTLERAKSFLLAEWMYSLSVTLLQANNELMQLLEPV